MERINARRTVLTTADTPARRMYTQSKFANVISIPGARGAEEGHRLLMLRAKASKGSFVRALASPTHGAGRYLNRAASAPARQVTNQELYRLSRLRDVGDVAQLVLQFGEYRGATLFGDTVPGCADGPRICSLAGPDRTAASGSSRRHATRACARS